MKQLYLDNHSGRRLDQRAFEAMMPYFSQRYGNAQSMHTMGSEALDAVERGRQQVADLLSVSPGEIYFTSGGSESNNLAIKGVATSLAGRGRHLVISAIEHASVLNAARRLEKSEYAVTVLEVDRHGLVDPDRLRDALRPDTILVSIQHANPEIGTIQDIAALSAAAHASGALFHTDAVSTAGIIDVNPISLGADLLTLSSSQMYGPKGAAALYVKKGVTFLPQIEGGIQEHNRRAGTENVPAIVGFGAAAEIAARECEENARHTILLRDRLIRELPQRIPYVYLNGHPDKRLPDNVNFSVEFIEGEGMLLLLDGRGIYVTSGSACTSRNLKMSQTLAALKIDPAIAQGSVTMTLAREHDDKDIDYLLEEFPAIVKQLRDLSPLYAYFLKTGQRQEAGPGTDYDHDHDAEENAG